MKVLFKFVAIIQKEGRKGGRVGMREAGRKGRRHNT